MKGRYVSIGCCLAVLLTACAPKSGLRSSDGPPVRCIVRWQGPGTHCAVGGQFRAEAVGLRPEEATRVARARLAASVRSGVRAMAISGDARRRTGIAEKSAACASEASQRASAACFPEPALTKAQQCRVEFPVPGCNTQRPRTVQGRPWTKGERARDALCASLEMPAGLGPGSTARCTSRCYQDARLICE